MKKSAILYLALLLSHLSFSQPPQAINYQGVARDSTGHVLINQNIAIRLSVLDSSNIGQPIYIETHFVNTNSTGLFNLAIGLGSVLSGNFSTIPWGRGNNWLMIEMDASGGNNFQLIGTTQFLSVPYALYAENSKIRVSYTGDTAFFGNTYFFVPGISTANYSVQGRLGRGETPLQLINLGFPLDSLYGKRFQGGIIFYYDTTSNSGMVCTTSDIIYFGGQWGCSNASITGAYETAIGTGLANTLSIHSSCSDPNCAANLCYNLISNGYDDWYLPSIEEVKLMGRHLGYPILGNGYTGTWYWSSTEVDANFALYSNIYYFNHQSSDLKSILMSIRAVRNF